MDLYKHFSRTRMVVWIQVFKDPHANFRGFSIRGRELRVQGYEPIFGEMEDLTGKRMQGKFWVVEAKEVYRAIPEMRRFPIRMEAWFFPFEFCDSLVRPDYYLQGTVVNHTLKSSD
jgi:hypothetical protein